jgi:hypothetical protein
VNFRPVAFFITCICAAFQVCAQEGVAPVNYNPLLKGGKSIKAGLKTTALSLPFFEDFTSTGVYPDDSKWIDRGTYVNNTMCFQPVSRGVATFDALNEKGGPYDSTVNTAYIYADSLTSQQINLDARVPGDSIYLSFFYQPQGNGFSPEEQDSLMLYFLNRNGLWKKMWGKEGTVLQPFEQVMVPVTDTMYLHGGFQFRFVNKASININDDVWNVDYIRLDANRGIFDTVVSDVATTIPPSFLLNDYTYMPYRHFKANQAGELATQHFMYARNNYSVFRNIISGYTARESLSNTSLFTSSQTSGSLAPLTEQQFTYPLYPISYNTPGPYSKVVFENKYYVTAQSVTEPVANDTIIREQIFDNYVAYDDGTAEKSYFLKLSATLPGKLAVEYHLNEPDTLRGVAIYFGRTVPIPSNKFFSIAVYKDIAVNGGTNDLIYQEDLFFPGFADTVNNFFIYKFDTPIPMAAGTFFLGTIQPANSGSDSLYIGLDVNRIGGNHLYLNVNNFWESSIVSGALMMRPLLGQKVKSTGIEEAGLAGKISWSVYPNPAQDNIFIRLESESMGFDYEVRDIQGRRLMHGQARSAETVDISTLTAGMYFVDVIVNGQRAGARKVIKL